MSITLYPTPSPEGVAKLQAYYRTRCRMEVSEETAFEVLSGIMRFLFLTEVRPPIPDPPATMPGTSDPAAIASAATNSPKDQS